MLVAFPGKPTNLTVTAISSRSATISWQDAKIRVFYNWVSNFRIQLKRDSNVIVGNITLKVVNEYKIYNLTPYTTYKISVSAGNDHGFGEESVTSFLTSEEGECEIRV